MNLVRYDGKPTFVGKDDVILTKIANFLGYASASEFFPPNCDMEMLALLKSIIDLAPADEQSSAKIVAIKVLRRLATNEDGYHLSLSDAKNIVEFCARATFYSQYIAEEV